MLQIFVTLDGCNIVGSPYAVNVVNLRPDADKCEVRGEALSHAVARLPAKFEINFVDAMGHPSQYAASELWNPAVRESMRETNPAE